MKMIDINKKFTETVQEYLAQGYTFNTSTMSGHQGEICKVDLTNGEEVIRVWMNREHLFNWSKPDSWSGYIIELNVGRATKIEGETIWMHHLETISSRLFYEVEKDKWYIEDLVDAIDIMHERKLRARYKTTLQYTQKNLGDEKYITIAGNYLKRKHGYKRISWQDVEVTKTEYYGGASYRVYYHGEFYTLEKGI